MKKSAYKAFQEALINPSASVFLWAFLFTAMQLFAIDVWCDHFLPRMIPTYLLRRGPDDLIQDYLNEINDTNELSVDHIVVLVGGSGSREAVESGQLTNDRLSKIADRTVRFFNMSTSGQTYVLSAAIISELSQEIPTTILIQVGSSILAAGGWQRDFHYPLPMSGLQDVLSDELSLPWYDFIAIRRMGPILRTAYHRWSKDTPPIETYVHFYSASPELNADTVEKLRLRVDEDLKNHYKKNATLNFILLERVIQISKERGFNIGLVSQPLNPAVAEVLGWVAEDTKKGLNSISSSYRVPILSCGSINLNNYRNFVDMSHVSENGRKYFTQDFVFQVGSWIKQISKQ